MKVLKEKFENFPEKCTTVVNAVEGQALEDTAEFDDRKAATEKEVEKNAVLPVDGAPKAIKPDEPIIPKPLLKEDLFIEDINEENAARIVQSVIKNSFGIDVDVQTYKDDKNSKSVIVQFIVSKDDNKKMIYDELKEKLYKRFRNRVNISCKTFSSPNLKEKSVEYKIKVFVIKERKNKNKAHAYKPIDSETNESLIEDLKRDRDYIIAIFPDTFIKSTGIDSISNKDESKQITKQRKFLKDYIESHFDVEAPGDAGESFQYDPKTESWRSEIDGTEENLKKFMQAVGIDAPIQHGVSAQSWEDSKETDDDPMDLFDLIFTELSSDLGWSAESKKRRIPATANDDMYNRYDIPLVPNNYRYRSEDSKNVKTNIITPAELRATLDGNIEVRPGAPGRGNVAHTLDFAKQVADEYSDYGVRFEVGKDKRTGAEIGIIYIPEEFQGVDIEKIEKQRRAEKYKDRYAKFKALSKADQAAHITAQKQAAKSIDSDID